MPRILFPFIIIGLFILLDVYVFQGYKSLINNHFEKKAFLAKGIYWVISIGIVASLGYLFFTYFTHPSSTARILLRGLIFIVFAAKLLFGTFLLLDDIIRLGQWGFQKVSSAENTGISRKQFILNTGALLGGSLGLGLTFGMLKGSHKYRVIKQKLALKNLPKAFEGFKILQISDVHSGSFWNKEAVKKGIQMINDQNADAVFFTGDIVNDDVSEMDEYIEIFKSITAPYGVYATLGNHDYGEYRPGYTKADFPKNVESMRKLHKQLGWDLLMNENRILEKEGEKIAVLGIENWGAKGRFPKYGKMKEAVQGVDNQMVQLLLSHDPSHWREEVLKEYPHVDCMFAGHTHGAQFGIELGGFKMSPSSLMYKDWAGIYESKGQQLYVNRGFGYLGFPGRLGIWPEITVFELEGSA